MFLLIVDMLTGSKKLDAQAGYEANMNMRATAFHMPDVMDQSSFEQWEEAGSKDTQTLGFERVDALLAEYEKPPIDEAVEEEVLEFVARSLSC